MNTVTRNVIIDLWPLYLSGDLSTDSRALVDDFLASDPELARRLRDEGASLESIRTPDLPPDHELKTLDRVKRRLWGPLWLLQLAMLFSALAFGRIVSDTSWDVSPKNFIIMCAIAGVFWIAFVVVLFRRRRSVLIRL